MAAAAPKDIQAPEDRTPIDILREPMAVQVGRAATQEMLAAAQMVLMAATSL